jgi:hypothetical protein
MGQSIDIRGRTMECSGGVTMGAPDFQFSVGVPDLIVCKVIATPGNPRRHASSTDADQIVTGGWPGRECFRCKR